MIPNPLPAGFLRCLLTSTLLLGLAAAAHATDYYISETGTGTSPGTLSNPMPPTQLATAISGLLSGETIYICSGNYSNAGIAISGSGTASSPKRLIGLDTGGGLPVFTGTYNPVGNVNQSTSFLKFNDGVAASYWEFKNLIANNYGVGVSMILSTNGSTFGVRSNLLFENIAFKNVQDGMRLRNVEQVVARNCSVTGHTKKGFRIAEYSRFVTFDSCTTDAIGGNVGNNTLSIPTGFCCDDTNGVPIIYDIRFVRCVARNCGYPQSDSDYWNGDGFSSERGAYNLTFFRCDSRDNNDGGFDHKAANLLFDNCISIGNKKGYRLWNSSWLINCIGAYSKKGAHIFITGTLGGTGSAEGVQIDPSGFALIDGGTFHNAADFQLGVEADGYGLEAYNAILSMDSTAPTASGFTTGAGILTMDSGFYKYPSTGTDPAYSSASATWNESTNPTGFNATNASYAGLGYYGQGAASTLPVAPTSLDAALDPTSPRRINLKWTDNSNNERDFLVERSTDNVNFTQIGSTGTNTTVFTDFGLSQTTTYYYRVRATNSVGNSAYTTVDSASTPAVTTPTAPVGLTAEVAKVAPAIDANPPGSTTLIWTDRSNNEDSFFIERSSDNVNFTQIARSDENYPTFTDPTTTQGNTYYYRVRASNTAGNSTYTNSAKILIPPVYILDDSGATGITQVGTWSLTTPGGGSTSKKHGLNYWVSGTDGGVGGRNTTFTPNLATTGAYDVYLWWTGGGNRADNVPVDINHSGGTTTLAVNEEDHDGFWNAMGRYNFSLGTGGSLKIRDDSANGVVIADAALFMPVPVGPSAPGSLTATAASASQVNLTWTDVSNENSYVIEYSTDNVTFTRLASVAPNAVSYSATDLAGGITHYFRVLANGNGGYSAPSNTANATTDNTIILDNADQYGGITVTGSWVLANAVSGSYNGNYLHDNDARSGKSVRFTPIIPQTGSYQVFARWTANSSNRATNAHYDVIHAGGTTTSDQNQKNNNNSWQPLGTFTFNAGTAGSVLLRDDGCDGFVIADAVKFVRVP